MAVGNKSLAFRLTYQSNDRPLTEKEVTFLRQRIVAAVDSRAGHVVIHGWRTSLPLTPVEAIHALEAFAGEFLYTHVDREGLMQGTDMAAIRAVRSATRRRVTAAGGITTQEEIDYLDSIGVDAVVGMAIYTGRLHVGRS